jgi:hypothetical protein
MKPRRPTAAEVIRADHMAARRGHLDALIARIEAQPLDAEWLFALQLLGELREGYDARESAGVEPKPGKPTTTGGYHKWIAWDYQLRRRAATGSEKDDAATVATTWGIRSLSHVRTIAAAHREPSPLTREQLDGFIVYLAPEYKRLLLLNRGG